jgi:glycosyltransferase involved in cell wall biosynthesis
MTSKKKKNLLFLSKGLARYRYTFTQNLAANLQEEANLIASPYGKNFWEVNFDELKKRNGIVKYIDFPNKWRELDKINADLLCIMEYSYSMLKALFWARKKRIPIIASTELGNGHPLMDSIPFHTRFIHRLAAHLTHGQIAFSPAAVEPYGANKRPIHFSPHSIDTTEFTVKQWDADSTGPVTILTVAQYIPRKGLDLMAKALAAISDFYKFKWKIIGTCDDSWLKNVIDQYNLNAKTAILGTITGSALIKEFQSSDLFVLPSRFDTYGVVTQEAAACGLPLLISRNAGSSFNLVRNEKNGFVIDPYNTLEFTSRLEFMLINRELWPKYGAASRLLAEKYCVRENAKSTADWLRTNFL